MKINKIMKYIAVFLIFSLNTINLNATAYILEESLYSDKVIYEYLTEDDYILENIKYEFQYRKILGSLNLSSKLQNGYYKISPSTVLVENIEVLFYFDGEYFNALFLTTLDELGFESYEFDVFFRSEGTREILSFSEELGFEYLGPGLFIRFLCE